MTMEDFHAISDEELNATFASVTARYGEVGAARIQPVLLANIINGRFDTFASAQQQPLNRYVERLIEGFRQYHHYINKLQVEKDDLVWMPLYARISKWIYNIFLHKGFDPIYTETEIMPELAQEASIQIMKASFTYDTDFDPWAYQIVRSTCYKYMRSAMKKSAIPGDLLLELDETLENSLPDEKQRPDDPIFENRAALLAAINKLSPERRELILQKYFYEFPSEEIAENTHKTVAAVYSMHFNAIETLRKILSD